MQEVTDFFEAIWAPAVAQLHTPGGGGVLAMLLADLCTVKHIPFWGRPTLPEFENANSHATGVSKCAAMRLRKRWLHETV